MTLLANGIMFDDREVHERFVRSWGSRGQNFRERATAVELRIDLATSSLPTAVIDRLIRYVPHAVTSDGILLVLSRADRSQAENRRAAHARLLALLLSLIHI